MSVSGKDSIILLAVLILLLIGATAILKVAWLGIVGSILVLLKYMYCSRIIKRKKREKFLLEERIKKLDVGIEKDFSERIKTDKVLKEFVDDNADLEGILFYRYYKDGEESGVMLIYETCHCSPNTNIDKIMQGYHDILLKEYKKLDEAEIHFISATQERAYASFVARIYGKDYVVVFIIPVKSYVEQKELDINVEKLKRDFILRSEL